VFTARYALSPYIKQIRFVFKGLNAVCFSTCDGTSAFCMCRSLLQPSTTFVVNWHLIAARVILTHCKPPRYKLLEGQTKIAYMVVPRVLRHRVVKYAPPLFPPLSPLLPTIVSETQHQWQRYCRLLRRMKLTCTARVESLNTCDGGGGGGGETYRSGQKHGALKCMTYFIYF
jgi:hypothetical protein